MLVLLWCFGALNGWAQLFPYQKSKLWGYADSSGELVLEPIYRVAGLMENGKAMVQLPHSPQYLLIDSVGHYLSPRAQSTMRDGLEGKITNHDLYSNYFFRDSLIYSRNKDLKEFLMKYPLVYQLASSSIFLIGPEGLPVRHPDKDRYVDLYPDGIGITRHPKTNKWCYLAILLDRYWHSQQALYFFDGAWELTPYRLRHNTPLRDEFLAFNKSDYQKTILTLYPFGVSERSQKLEEVGDISGFRWKKKWHLKDKRTRISYQLRGVDTIHFGKNGGALAERWRRKDTLYFFINTEWPPTKLAYKGPIEHLGHGLFALKRRANILLVNLQGDTLASNFRDFKTITPWYATALVNDQQYIWLLEQGRWKYHKHLEKNNRVELLKNGALLEYDYEDDQLFAYSKVGNAAIDVTPLAWRNSIEAFITPEQVFYASVKRVKKEYLVELLDENWQTIFNRTAANKNASIEYVQQGVFRFYDGLTHYYFNKKGVCFWSE